MLSQASEGTVPGGGAMPRCLPQGNPEPVGDARGGSVQGGSSTDGYPRETHADGPQFVRSRNWAAGVLHPMAANPGPSTSARPECPMVPVHAGGGVVGHMTSLVAHSGAQDALDDTPLSPLTPAS